MSYIPETSNPSFGFPEPESVSPLSITVTPPEQYKAPIGFTAWSYKKPKPKKKPKKPKKGK